MKMRPLLWLGVVAVIGIFAIGSLLAFERFARHQTMSYVQRFEPAAEVEFQGFRVSKRNLFRVKYQVALAHEFSRAEWCLLPFGDIDLKK